MLKFKNNLIKNNLYKLFNRLNSTATTSTVLNKHSASFDNITIMTPTKLKGPLSDKDLEYFNENGYVVIKNHQIIEDSLLSNHQKEVREYLKKNAAIDFGNTKIGSIEESLLLASQESKLSNVSNGFGGMVNFYHGKYEYQIREHQNLYDSFVQLFQATYSSTTNENTIYNDENEWPNEYGNFDPHHMYMFINRCGFRVPTFENLGNGEQQQHQQQQQQQQHQKGTGLHLDCNPFHLFRGEKLNQDKQIEHIPLRFWQPIQAFVSCTDSPKQNQGGFWTVPKFHKKCVKYFNDHNKLQQQQQQQQQEKEKDKLLPTELGQVLKRGNAYDFQDGQHLDIINQLTYIPIERGDVVFWDWRMPHCNDIQHYGPSIREVVYSAHLPMVPVNTLYNESQKIWYQTGKHPNYVAKKYANLETINYSPPKLSNLGKKLLSIDNDTF